MNSLQKLQDLQDKNQKQNYKKFRRTSRMKSLNLGVTFKPIYRNTCSYNLYDKIIDHYEVYKGTELIDLVERPSDYISTL